MARATTASFVCELPLRVTPADERELLIRLNCARMIYNACLGASLGWLAQLRESRSYKEACQLPKGARHSEAARNRAEAFKRANEQVGFREYDLHAYAQQFGHAWVGERLDSFTIQKVATRAFQAVQQYAFGKRGRPRFKGKGWYDSVEGKTNSSGILWREDAVRWLGLELPAIINFQDEVIAHGLSCPVKFVRLVRRKLNQRNRFFAQLICEGQPYRKDKHPLGQGVVGLDIGLSTIAIVSQRSATLERFCTELEPQQQQIRKLQRKMDRQRRAGNPDHYYADGTCKPGAKGWHISQRYVSTRAQFAELHRKQAAHRKSLHGHMINRILAQGNVIKLERLSYRAFQQTYGKSVGFRAPGTFVNNLRRKAANAGAEVDEFPTVSTHLSQVCLCGAIEKKPLSLRWHRCDCGVGPIQRDVFSAWLARYVVNNKLDAGQAQAAWPGEDERLRVASREIQPAMGQGQPKPNLARGQSRSPAQSGVRLSEACHGAVPAVTRELAFQSEPPALAVGSSQIPHMPLCYNPPERCLPCSRNL